MKILITIFFLTSLVACSSTPIPTPSNTAGKMFPKVSAKSLDGETVSIPDKFIGKPSMLLIGYKQNAQFDIDRWILGILQADIPVQIVELPTIAGMMPQMVQSFIDNGMRKGIPKEDWASVVTVYEDASKIIEAIGNENPQNAHAVLLNKNAEIVWISNRGYSAQQILDLKRLVETLS